MSLGRAAAGPIVRQGNMDAAVAYDVQSRNSIINKNRNGGRGSLYGLPERSDAWDILEREITFTTIGGRPQARTAVLSALNGLGAEASAAYAGRPDEQELVQLAVRNSIQPLGINVETIRGEEGKSQTGGATSLAGLNSLIQSPDAKENIRVGDLVEALIPLPKNNARLGHSNNAGAAGGVPIDKYRLEGAPLDPASAGRRLRLAIREIVVDPAVWNAAMGPHLRGTRIWHAASRSVIESYLTGLVLGLNILVKEGLVDVTGTLADVARLQDADGFDGGSPAEKGEITAVALAQALDLIRSGSVRANMLPMQRKRMALLRHTLASSIFHDGVNGVVNKAYEFGYHGKPGDQAAVSKTRAPDNTLLRHNPYGDVVHLQLNHFVRAVSGFHDAILDAHRFVLGKAITDVSQDRTKKFHLASGVCKL